MISVKADKFYVLRDKEPVAVGSVEEWAKEFSQETKIVAKTEIGQKQVSTVFLGIDHRIFGEGPPLLFETMIFGPANSADEYQTRCSTWAEAEEMHKKACEHVWKELL